MRNWCLCMRAHVMKSDTHAASYKIMITFQPHNVLKYVITLLRETLPANVKSVTKILTRGIHEPHIIINLKTQTSYIKGLGILITTKA